MTTRLSAAALLGSRALGSLAQCCAPTAAAAAAAARVVVRDRGPDHPLPRNPDIWPTPSPADTPDSPSDPMPNPDLYPPDIGTPRRDPDVLPPRYPAPDIYPPGDMPPDMPEPPLPGKGPFMAAGFGLPPSDSFKHPAGWPQAALRLAAPPRPEHAHPLVAGGSPLLLKTDGGSGWRGQLRCRGVHSGAAGLAPGGRSMSGEEQEAANKSSAAMEGVQKQDDDIPTGSYVEQRANTPPEVTHVWGPSSLPACLPALPVALLLVPQVAPRVATEAPDKLPAGSPPESQPGYTIATGAPTAHIGKVSDDSGDVPEATSTRSIKPKVGPKASTGLAPDVPVEVPKPGFPK
ncbi:hypothetical protein C2E20_1551 [Micractinium conductrix]|uniref:Uncharacterized protein n=1 Tax=Micractinium conductrix TaxID=554055 RepID=A0A2P6VMS8_9CHLO|nr:hypothetical protein C2E20_1551 [Micractinium conductrix]|eukprot:PSC75390.1 hypothetical protein C2E20_1551 [Micractinium conductrix]